MSIVVMLFITFSLIACHAIRQRLQQFFTPPACFDPAEPIGFGFLGMQERVQALGGKYWVESNIGRGTWVRIAIPIQEQPVASRPRDDETAP